ncbi:MAG: hypothetical protein EHM55_04295 [Acidobacteria bacterium]|nr:MAG: hypothetical protein EHM55_04295 [Acidobacteriota bacterium]
MTRTNAFAVTLVGLAVAVFGPPAMANRETNSEPVPSRLPGQDLPVVREHTYRMAGKIRMLLLWVGRDDVGSGVIKWRGRGHNRAFEVLIGSDPQKAPNQLNKWGFLLEEVRGSESAVVGLISQENDDKLSEVRADLRRRKDLRAFDTIRGLVTTLEGNARVGTLHAPSELTYHDVGMVLEGVFADTSLEVKRVPRRGDVRAGFLSSLTEMITSTLERKPVRRIPYIHGDRLYELRLLESTPLARFERDGRTFPNVIRGRFETGEAGRRSGTRFELVYGASGALAGVPILISYQPKWWLQVDLVLHP